MTLEQLRIFVGVAEREHVTRAAEALHVTQSAASAAVAALEAWHGVALFHRVGRGIELTEAGRVLLEEARAVLARAAQAERALAEFAGLSRGTLKLVASQTIASYWLPAAIAGFHACYPAIELALSIANTEVAAASVRDGSAELGFVEGRIDDPALARWQVGQDQMLLVSADPIPGIDKAWLAGARWVLREQGSGTRSTMEALLADRGIAATDMEVALTLPSNEAVRTAVEAGAGVSLLSALVAAPSIEAGKLHGRPLDAVQRPFFALRHKERYRSKAADAFLDLLGQKAA